MGHYVNSVHLWSVELFFGFMVVHLWGKLWMAAWRGRRALTWISGILLFLVSIGTSFTGFLSQSNFSAQWIAAEGKDGINSIGAGAFFNVLNPAQMLLWHVVLLPLGVGLLTQIRIILVRRRGVVPPLDAELASRATSRDHTPDSLDFPTRRYDLVKEFVLALVVVTVLSLGLAAIFSSPDDKAITMSGWAKVDPDNLVTTAASELAGTTTSAT